MELQTAIEILEYHQEWRLGKREDMIHEPKKLTEALDIVLTEFKKMRLGEVSSSADLKIGDKIDIGGFITELKEIKYDPYARMDLYWFYNENGEYKYNVREWITKV